MEWNTLANKGIENVSRKVVFPCIKEKAWPKAIISFQLYIPTYLMHQETFRTD